MIKIILSKLTPEGEAFSGEEPSEFLDLNDDENIFSTGPVHYEFNAQLVSNGVLVRGKAVLPLECCCSKCLAKYDFKFESEICHFYEKPNKNEIDLTDDIREDILIVLPQKFECSKSCRGICFKCGQNLNKKLCTCKREEGEEQENVWQELNHLKLGD